MAALTDYSKWDAIDDSSDAASEAEEQQKNAPNEDPVLTGAKNVVCQLRAKLSLLPEGTLDEGWTSPPLPGGASKRELFTATCLRLGFPGIFSNEEEAACPHVDNCAEINARSLRDLFGRRRVDGVKSGRSYVDNVALIARGTSTPSSRRALGDHAALKSGRDHGNTLAARRWSR